MEAPVAPAPIVRPLQRLGDVIGRVPGFSVFAGPLGWVLTALLLLGVTMMVSAFAWGRRRHVSAAAAPAGSAG